MNVRGGEGEGDVRVGVTRRNQNLGQTLYNGDFSPPIFQAMDFTWCVSVRGDRPTIKLSCKRWPCYGGGDIRGVLYQRDLNGVGKVGGLKGLAHEVEMSVR